MANPSNIVQLTGRVAKGGVKSFPNSDGSTKLLFTLAIDEDFIRRGKTTPDTDFVDLEAFVPKTSTNGIGSWANIGEGDLIQVAAKLTQKSYVNKNGETVYPTGPKVEVDGYPRYLEPKSVTDARKAKKLAEAGQAQAVAVPAQGAAQPTVAELEAQLAAARQAQAQGDASEHPFG